LSFFFQAEDGIRDRNVTGVQTCALPILRASLALARRGPVHVAGLARLRDHRLPDGAAPLFAADAPPGCFDPSEAPLPPVRPLFFRLDFRPLVPPDVPPPLSCPPPCPPDCLLARRPGVRRASARRARPADPSVPAACVP